MIVQALYNRIYWWLYYIVIYHIICIVLCYIIVYHVIYHLYIYVIHTYIYINNIYHCFHRTQSTPVTASESCVQTVFSHPRLPRGSADLPTAQALRRMASHIWHVPFSGHVFSPLIRLVFVSFTRYFAGFGSLRIVVLSYWRPLSLFIHVGLFFSSRGLLYC